MQEELVIEESEVLYTPNEGGQQGFMDDYEHRYCALAGGWYGGKTWAGARKLLDLHVFNAFDQFNQPTFIASAVIAPTYQNAQDFDIPEIKKALDEMNLSWTFNNDLQKFWFILTDLGTERNPSLIRVRTADKPERLTGWSAGAIWGDEVARWKTNDDDPLQDPLTQADARLRGDTARFLQFMMTFTHEGDTTKVYRDFEESPKPDHVLYRTSTYQNPYAQQFAKAQEAQLSPDLAHQYLMGMAMSIRGQKVYERFDARLNQSDKIQLRDDLPLQMSFDFNIEPGMFAILGQWDPKNEQMTAVHEIHRSRLSVRVLMDELKGWFQKHYGGFRWPLLQIFGDASGSSEWAGTGEDCWTIVKAGLRKAGIPFHFKVPTKNPPVSERAASVNMAFQNMAGRIRYIAHPRCKNLLEDWRKLKWNTDGEIDKSDRKRSHPSDADGYRVHWLLPVRRSALG